MNNTYKAWISGTLGAYALTLLYFIVLTISNSLSHAIDQFLELWYLYIPLIMGFGIQIGLFSYVKNKGKQKHNKEVLVSGGVTTGSMVLCCAHHVVDFIPLLGVSAAAIFLIELQVPFMLLGIYSNILGIIHMLYIIKKSGLYGDGSFSSFFKLDLRRIRNVLALIFMFLFILSLVITL